MAFRDHRLGHPRVGVGKYHVGGDAMRSAGQSHHIGQPHHSSLGRGVGHAVGAPAHPAGRGGEHQAPIALFLHDRKSRLREVKRTVEMDRQGGCKVLGGMLHQALVADDAGVVDHDVNRAKGVQGGLKY